MKIGDLNSINQTIRTMTGVERREATAAHNSFRNELSIVNRANCYDELMRMSGEIAKQGEVLRKKVDIRELKKYKEMIAEFMYEAVKYSFEFNKESTLDARGRHRIYATIKKLNTKLEELTKALLSEEKDQIAIMSSIDDIRGLLLDLLL